MKQKVGMLMCWSLRCLRLLELLEGCRENGNRLILVERGCGKIGQGASVLFMKLLLAMWKLRVPPVFSEGVFLALVLVSPLPVQCHRAAAREEAVVAHPHTAWWNS